MRDYRSIDLWKDVTPAQWSDWKWQVANRITTVAQLRQVINMSDDEAEVVGHSLNKLRMAVTPYYALLMDPDDANCPVRKQAVPTIQETHIAQEDQCDPLHEDIDSPAPGLTHRYPDRGILLITDQCSMYCRHCTRRRIAGDTDNARTRENLKPALEYLRKTTTFRDILLTGGDPLTVGDDFLDWLLGELRAIPHIEIIRIGSRTPVVMPQRITDSLCSILRKYHPLWLNTHFNHPKEVTDEARDACARLADSGVPLGNQSVLLKGVNDCPYIFRELNQKLLTLRVRPYYIYQCDLSMGISHFRTSVGKGIEIMEFLRGHTTGMAVPMFIVDAPGGGGKIPVMPNYVVSRSDRKVILRNYEGVITTYTEPEDNRSVCGNCSDICERQRKFSREGLIQLFEGDKVSIGPSDLTRLKRSKH